MTLGDDVYASISLVLGYFEAGVFIVNLEIEPIPLYFFLGHQHPQPA
jgi:hypothetical protein